MLFARNALASAPQACLCPGKRIAKVKGGKYSPSGRSLDKEELRAEGNFFRRSRIEMQKLAGKKNGK